MIPFVLVTNLLIREMIRFLLLALFVWLAAVYGLPEIKFVSESQIIDPGGDASLSCYFLNPGVHSIGWIKSNDFGKSEPISMNKTLKISDPRYSLITDDFLTNNTSEFTELMRVYRLDIKNVVESDNGTYYCLIYINDSLILHGSTSLLIIPNELKRENVLLGDSSHLECVSSKFHFTNVVWTAYGKSLLPEGSTVDKGILIIPSTISSDTGLYICHAEFVIGNAVSQVTRNVQLVVYPPLNVKARNEKIIRPLGYNVNMSCIIDTMSSVIITWSKNNQPLEQGPRVQMHLFETKWEFGSFVKSLKVAELYLKSITEDDYGLYHCSVENEFGIGADSIKLAAYL